jgi:hypothetical protein
MRSCGFCGDRYDSDTVHECWVQEKLSAQENLREPIPTDYVPLGRDIEADADWQTNHD